MKTGLLKRGKQYSVRIIVPKDLQQDFRRNVIVRSLKTSESKQARLLLAQTISRAEDLFFRMRAGMLDKSALTNILKNYIDDCILGRLDEFDSIRISGDKERFAKMTSCKKIAELHDVANEIRMEIRGGFLPNYIRRLAIELLDDHGIEYDVNSPEIEKFCQKFALIFARSFDEAANRTEGKTDYSYKQFVDGVIEERMQVTLNIACGDYIESKNRKGLKSGTLKGYRGIIKSILEFYGEDYLIKNLHNKEMLRYVDEQKSNGLKNIAINHKTKRLQEIIKLACINYGISPWQYHIELHDDKLDVKPLSGEDLNALFLKLNELNQGIPWQYWITLIALLTGLRQEEVTNICYHNVESVDGVYQVRVEDGKTENATRTVPISDILLKLGFLDFWDERKKTNEPFPFMFHYNKKYKKVSSTKVSDWFANLKGNGKRKLNFGKEKRFHSLRHNFADALKQGEVNIEMREELCGHKKSTGDSEQLTYTEYYRLPLKKAAIDKAKWDCDFTLLRTWR